MNFKLLLENFKKVLKEESINDNLALMVKGDGEEIKFVLYNFRELLKKDIYSLYEKDTKNHLSITHKAAGMFVAYSRVICMSCALMHYAVFRKYRYEGVLL
jgi:hypothetical protein